MKLKTITFQVGPECAKILMAELAEKQKGDPIYSMARLVRDKVETLVCGPRPTVSHDLGGAVEGLKVFNQAVETHFGPDISEDAEGVHVGVPV